jgi:hypothetical protein
MCRRRSGLLIKVARPSAGRRGSPGREWTSGSLCRAPVRAGGMTTSSGFGGRPANAVMPPARHVSSMICSGLRVCDRPREACRFPSAFFNAPAGSVRTLSSRAVISPTTSTLSAGSPDRHRQLPLIPRPSAGPPWALRRRGHGRRRHTAARRRPRPARLLSVAATASLQNEPVCFERGPSVPNPPALVVPAWRDQQRFSTSQD